MYLDRNKLRDKQIKVSVSDEEYAQLQREAESIGMQVSAYVREISLNKLTRVSKQQLVTA